MAGKPDTDRPRDTLSIDVSTTDRLEQDATANQQKNLMLLLFAGIKPGEETAQVYG